MGREKAASAYKEETGMSHGVIIKDAVKRYGDFTALKGVNLEIKQGEFFTLLGPSGCGKTTLLRMIAGFNSVDGGEICFDDKVINNLEAHKRDIGMVFQNYAIFPHLTVAENVAYGLKAKKYPKDQIPGKVEEALDLVQIKNLKDRKPNELSGGQQQRVALARAFVIEPGFSTSSYYNDFKVYKLFVGPKVECLPIRLEYNNSWCVFLSILCQWIYLVAFRSRWCLFPLE